jgi:hypothetical protein
VLNQAGLRYVEILSTVQAMYQQTSENPDAPPVLSAQANRLLDDAMQEAVDRGCAFVETTHLALACSRADVPSSIKPLVAGREQAIRDAARGALEQSARLEDELRARRQTGASHLDGLERANVVRTRRAQLKRDLNNGRISMHEVLLDAPDFVQTAKVGDLLRAVPTYSRASVARILARCRITPDKTIQGLSPRQREALIESLRPA